MPETTPTRECDLIMRGGITSGIVYPRAIARLAGTFRFRSIGGTSAGAIAATIAAAAELGRCRAKGSHAPFARLARIPQELGATAPAGGSMLRSLFQPDRRVAHLMRAALAKGWGGRALGLLTPLGIVIAAAGLILAVLLFATQPFGMALAWSLLALLLAAVAAAGMSAWQGLRALPDLGFGLCGGLGQRDRPGLTDWMHARIQEAAGSRADGPPVTFGDLWGADRGERATTADDARQIELVLLTTNVGRGLSHRVPFIEGSFRGRLYFREQDMARLFPAPVLAWMLAHPRKRPEDPQVPAGFHALPEPWDLPILFGARLSLSFPGLLAQVPLWTADPVNADIPPRMVCCWFSDGGLTSNFPISLFDSPLPRRPTFGINLVPLMRAARAGPGEPFPRIEAPIDDDDWTAPRVFEPATVRDEDGIATTASRGALAQTGSYLARLNDVARNWGETELSMMPGYRDRIVHVALSGSEGGMNLDMPAEVIGRLGQYGEQAADVLIARYADGAVDPLTEQPPVVTWQTHQRVRMRAFFAGYEEMARRLARGWSAGGYDALLASMPAQGDADAFKYKWASAADRSWALATARTIVDTCASLAARGPAPLSPAFDTDDDATGADGGRSPRPKVVLRLTQPGDNDPLSEVTR
jgi:hypothetical protein